jgi:hypothetical protein
MSARLLRRVETHQDAPSRQSVPGGCARPDLPPEIEGYPVHYLPIIKAYADQRGLVSLIHHSVPTEMDVEVGTIALGLVLDTLSGRSPLYRLEEFFAPQDTELLVGQALPPHALNDDTVGRVLDRLYDMGTLKLCTACAVRAAATFGFECRRRIDTH